MKALFFSLILSSTTFSSPTFLEIRKFIEDHKTHTIEAFLNEIPKEWVESYLLMRHSRSLQFASHEQPRVITTSANLFNENPPEKWLIMSFTSTPKVRGSENIEMIEVDSKRGTFDFYRVVFPKKPEGNILFDEKPRLCTQCHGTPGKPIWDTYGAWPDAYGSLTTTSGLPPDEIEMERLKELQSHWSSFERLKRLNREDRYFESKNSQFGKLIHQVQAQALHDSFFNHQDNKKIENALRNSEPGHAFLSDLPLEWQERGGQMFKENIKRACEYGFHNQVKVVKRLLINSNRKLDRRLFDFWDASSIELKARMLTLAMLLKKEEIILDASMTLPRRSLAFADGHYGLLFSLLERFSSASRFKVIDIIYEENNRVELSNDLTELKLVEPHPICGPLSAKLLKTGP